MGLLLTCSRVYIPQFIQKRKLDLLFETTAAAFQVAAPSTGGLSLDERLKLYARFTRNQADRSLRQANLPEIQSRLFDKAYRIGQDIRMEFNIRKLKEALQMSSVIYKILKIEFRGESQDNIVIPRCFFSAYYSGEVCRLVSSLDAGLLAGLSGGGKLSFSQRITEGSDCCRAYLDMSGRGE